MNLTPKSLFVIVFIAICLQLIPLFINLSSEEQIILATFITSIQVWVSKWALNSPVPYKEEKWQL